jgi:hypothetical protein
MDESQSKISDQKDQKPPSAVDVFEQLSSEESVIFFGKRIVREQQLFNLEAEITSIDVKKDSTYQAVDPIIRNEKLNEDELKTQLRDKRVEIESLDDREDDVHYLADFMRNRSNQWRISKTMVFGIFEPDTQSLVESVVSAAHTDDSGFMPVDTFRAMIDTTQSGIDIDAKEDPITVPLASIVTAVGFISWEKGKGEHYKKEGTTSAELIKKYAALPTEIPPVESATALILLDGSVIIMSREGHRVAAAKLKGQQYMQIQYLKVKRAKRSSSS